ncbi:hypothetical protein DFJ73DRAFT_917058 [Zopfochytrium polystomum]|nr:hypothetical protein DFJ73DRAFT_917058 [Zopfochytrium polystomum]
MFFVSAPVIFSTFLAFPTLHYTLLTAFPRLPHAVIAPTLIVASVITTLVVRARNPDVQEHVFTMHNYVLMLVLKSVGVTRESTAAWSLGDYVKYLLTGTIKHHAPSTAPCTKPSCCVRPADDASKLHPSLPSSSHRPSLRVAFAAVANIAGVFLTMEYLRRYRPLKDPSLAVALADLTDWRRYVDAAAAFREILKRFYQSPLQQALEIGVFRPSLVLYRTLLDGDVAVAAAAAKPATRRRRSPLPAALAVLTTFFASGLLHEWASLCTAGYGDPRLRGWHMAFFLLHGAVCVAERAVARSLAAAGRLESRPGSMMRVVEVTARWVATMGFVVLTGQVFARPYAVNGVFTPAEKTFRLPLPIFGEK